MALVRAIWFVITLPFRAFFWFVWQSRRLGLVTMIKLQRRFGQRNANLILAAAFAALGAALLFGVIHCSPGGSRCQPGGEPIYGILCLVLAAVIALTARRLSNDRTPTVSVENDYLRYDPDEFALSWRSVFKLTLFALLVAGGVGVVLWLSRI